MSLDQTMKQYDKWGKIIVCYKDLKLVLGMERFNFDHFIYLFILFIYFFYFEIELI